jgi:hypothetical protein
LIRDRNANPFSPGASRPRLFIGREEYIREFEVSLAKWESDGTAPPVILLGLPGVGKSALLNRFGDIASNRGWTVAQRQKVTAKTDLRRVFAQAFNEVEAQIFGGKTLTRKVQGLLDRFKETKVEAGFLSVSLGGRQEASTGSLEQDLTHVLTQMAELTRSIPVLFILDEIQFLPEDSLRAVIYAFDELQNRQDPTTKDRFPVTLVAAGLPQAKLLCQSAGQYAERFSYPRVVAFTRDEAIRAFRETARLNNGDFTPEAAARGYDLTEGYPHFIQVYGELAWIHGKDDPISLRDVEAIHPLAKTVLEEGFYSTRLELAGPDQQELLLALARLVVRSGTASHTLTAIATEMGRDPAGAGHLFQPLVAKGLLYQARPRGPYELTLPRFAEYLVSV